MIRVNLKKGMGGNEKRAPHPLISKTLGKLSLSQSSLNASFVVLSLVLVALAGVPHLFFVKYREHVRDIHKKNMESLESEEARLKSEINKYQSFQTEIKNIEEQQLKIKLRLDVVKELQNKRTAIVNMLDSIAQALPQRARLESISLSFKESGLIEVKGKAFSNDDITDYVSKLNASIYFEKVYLDGVNTAKGGQETVSEKSFLVVLVPKGMDTEKRSLTGTTQPVSNR